MSFKGQVIGFKLEDLMWGGGGSEKKKLQITTKTNGQTDKRDI